MLKDVCSCQRADLRGFVLACCRNFLLTSKAEGDLKLTDFGLGEWQPSRRKPGGSLSTLQEWCSPAGGLHAAALESQVLQPPCLQRCSTLE
jgi:hypothetical protein